MVGPFQILVMLGIGTVVLLALLLFQIPLSADPERRKDAYKLGAFAVILAVALGIWCFRLMDEQVQALAEVRPAYSQH